MGGGTTIRNEEPRINALQVNRSTYGVVLPIVMGTNRVSANIIDYVDFTAYAHVTKTHSGKGGGGVTQENVTYTYTVGAALSLCDGYAYGVGRIWADKEQKTLDELEMDLYVGEVWDYMQTNHPDKALRYSGTSYVAGVLDLGGSGSIPNLTFELFSNYRNGGNGFDENPSAIISELLTNKTFGAGFPTEYIGDLQLIRNYCDVMEIRLSPVIDEQEETQEIITRICNIANAEPVWSQGKLKFVPYSDQAFRHYTPVNNGLPIYDLTYDDFISDSNEPITISRKDDADAFNVQSIEFLNRSNEYNIETIEVKELADIEENGLRPAEAIECHEITTATVARTVAQTLLQRNLYVRKEYEFKLGIKYCLLEPMDIVTLTCPYQFLEKEPVRITSIQEDSEGYLEIKAEQCPYGVSSVTLYPAEDAERVSVNYNSPPDETSDPVIFFPVDEITESGMEVWIAAGSYSKNWGGCGVWVSDDNASFKNVGRVTNPARFGVLTNTFASGLPTDNFNICPIDLTESFGSLKNVSVENRDNLDSLCLVGNELIAYQNATSTAPHKYNLQYIKRGCYNTPISSHSVGTRFIRLDDAIFKYKIEKKDVGKTIYVKFTPYNMYGSAEVPVDEVDSIPVTLAWTPPPSVSNISITENTEILQDGTVSTNLTLNFDEVEYNNLRDYGLEYQINGTGDWKFYGYTPNSGCEIMGIPNTKSVKVRIKTYNKFGLSNDGVESSLYTIVGKSNPPPNITNFTATRNEYNKVQVLLKCDAIDVKTTKDLKGYEWRVGGTTFENSTPIGPITVANEAIYTASANGTYRFFVKAIDNSNVYSVTGGDKTINLIITPDSPVVNAPVKDITDRTKWKITWAHTADKDRDCYVIKDSGVKIAEVKDNFYNFTATQSKTYNLSIETKSIGGKCSSPISVNIVSSIEAPIVTGFTVEHFENDKSKIRLKWDKFGANDLDVPYVEIHEGNSFDSYNTKIAERYANNFIDIILTSTGQKKYWIKALTIAGNYSTDAAYFGDYFDLAPTAPTGLVIEADVNDKTIIKVSWNSTEEIDLDAYILKYGLDWNSGTLIYEGKATFSLFYPSISGDHKFMICARNKANILSDMTTKSQYITLEPKDVTGFIAYQNGEEVLLKWDENEDASSFIVMQGATFDGGLLVKDGITGTELRIPVDFETEYKFHIKAVNRLNKQSQLAKSASVNVANLPPKNIVFDYDELVLQNGTHTCTEFGSSSINFGNIPGTFDQYPTTPFDEIGGSTVLKLQPKSLIVDYHFDGAINTSYWKNYTGSGTFSKNASGNLLWTSGYAGSTSPVFDFTEQLESNTVYVVEFKFRCTKAPRTCGFITNTGGWSTLATPNNFAISNVVNTWITVTKEFTTGTTTASDPGRFMFAYGAYVVGDTVEIEYAKIYKKSGQAGSYTYWSNGEYLTPVNDMGQIITAKLSGRCTPSVLVKGNFDAKLQYRTSTNNTDWTEWTDFVSITATFRYIQYKAVMYTNDNTKTPEISVMYEAIDVPDVIKTGTATVASAGSTINFGYTFYSRPNNPVVLPQAIGSGLRAEIISNTTTGFTVKVVNATTGASVGGQIFWLAKGY